MITDAFIFASLVALLIAGGLLTLTLIAILIFAIIDTIEDWWFNHRR